jgi:hypothetical protein
MPESAGRDDFNRGDGTVTLLTDHTETRLRLAARAADALAAREAEYRIELARIETERAERLERLACELFTRIAGGMGCITWRTPDRRPGGWELAFEADELDFVVIDHDDTVATLRLITRCPDCGEPRESEALRDLADLGAAIRDGDELLCLACLGPEWNDDGRPTRITHDPDTGTTTFHYTDDDEVRYPEWTERDPISGDPDDRF